LEQVQHVDLSVIPLGGGLLAAGIVALVLLVKHENRTPSPLIPLGLLRQPAIWHSDALAACHGGALVSLITFLPVYLQVVRGASPSETGFLLVPLTIGIGTGSLVTGRLMNKTGLTTVYPIVGLSLATAIFVVLAFWASGLGTPALAGLLLCIGLCMGTVMGVVQVSVQSAAGQLRLGEAAASVQFSRSIGAAFGTALVATVLFAYLALRNPEAARIFATMVKHVPAEPTLAPDQRAAIQADIQEAFRAAFLTMAAFTTGGFFLALTNPLRRI
jgi:predicted MFS family arabinose efflux permease